MAHRLESLLNAPADDILEAIANGFRAQADVKGKLAELYLARHLAALQDTGKIDHYRWNDKDGVPDFEVMIENRCVIVECKNVRSDKRLGGPGYGTVELQKTRGGTDAHGNMTRGYRFDHFDVIGACLFNQTGQWQFRFLLARRLERRPDSADHLVVMQRVEYEDMRGWTSDLLAVLHEAVAQKR